jgi:uncharacterized protein (TIGR02270 family)
MGAANDLVLWDVCEEHFDEATFLWGLWEKALLGGNYTLRSVVRGPEERLRANLDALVLGGRALADKLLLPALEEGEPGQLEVAAWSLLHQDDWDGWPLVLPLLQRGEPEARQRVGRAFSHGVRPDLAMRLSAIWGESDAATRSLIMDVVAPRNLAWAHERLGPAFESGEPALVAAALRALRWVPDPAFVWYVNQALVNPDASVRGEAIAPGFMLASPGVWATCRQEAESPGPATRLALGLLALPGAPGAEVLESCLANPAVRKDAIWALGFAGNVAAADRLVALTRDEKLGSLAAEALSAITAVDISGPLWRPPTRPGPEVEEVGDDDPPPQVEPEDDLPEPDPDALANWWQRTRPRYSTAGSFVYGRPRSVEALRQALIDAAMWRRPLLALEAAAWGRTGVQVDVSAWAAGQLQLLGG